MLVQNNAINEDDTTTTINKSLDLLGISVHHLQTVLINEVCSVGFTEQSKIFEIENLQGPPGWIRKKSATVVSPVDGKVGASYVHCLEGEDHVGLANYMLSYSWRYALKKC